jgi:hypothetical protein
MGLIDVIQPLRGNTLHSQGIQEEASDDADRKDDDPIEHSQQDSRLKVADLRQDNENTENPKTDQHGHQPPPFDTPKK